MWKHGCPRLSWLNLGARTTAPTNTLPKPAQTSHNSKLSGWCAGNGHSMSGAVGIMVGKRGPKGLDVLDKENQTAASPHASGAGGPAAEPATRCRGWSQCGALQARSLSRRRF